MIMITSTQLEGQVPTEGCGAFWTTLARGLARPDLGGGVPVAHRKTRRARAVDALPAQLVGGSVRGPINV